MSTAYKNDVPLENVSNIAADYVILVAADDVSSSLESNPAFISALKDSKVIFWDPKKDSELMQAITSKSYLQLERSKDGLAEMLFDSRK